MSKNALLLLLFNNNNNNNNNRQFKEDNKHNKVTRYIY